MKKPNKDLFLIFRLFFVLSLALVMGMNTLIDPTRPPNALLPDMGANANYGQSLQLTAIFIYSTYRSAIIGGRYVTIGDQIGEFTITNISPYTVELTSSKNQKEVLQLLPSVKQQKGM